MSSISFRGPEFRLHLGYPHIALMRSSRTLGVVPTDAPDFGAALAQLLDMVSRARARLVVVLPAAEVWRGRLDLAGRNRDERRASARTIVAARLGVAPDEVTLALGPRDAAGSFPVAGVRRSTLQETRALLAALRLRPASIVGAGAFPGFAAAPRLGGWSWSLPAIPPARRGAAAALGAGAAAGLAALLLLGLPVPPTGPTLLAPAPPAPAIEVAALPVAPPAAVVELPAPPAPLALRFAERPKPRPAPAPVVTLAARNLPPDLPADLPPKAAPRSEPALQKLAEAAAAAPIRALDAITAPLRRPAAAKPAPQVAEVARTAMPVLPAPAAAPELRPMRRPAPNATAERPAAPAGESAALSPRPRRGGGTTEPAVLVASLEPAAAIAATVAAATATATATAAPVMAPPPPSRPEAPRAVKAAPAKPAVKPVVVRPTPVPVKPVAAKPVRVPPQAEQLRVAAPRSGLKALPVAQPPVRLVMPQAPVVVRQVGTAPARTQVASLAPQKAAPQPVRQKLVAQPAPKKAVQKPARLKPAKAQPVAQQARAVPQQVEARPPTLSAQKSAKPANHRVGLSRGNVSLVGIFGGSDGRHALVRLPNGKIERVKAGDEVQGVRIATVSEDSVRLTGRGRDTLLRLPD